jgi:lysophospholipid acyltransferase (LPLAT)-like uncharacterized protein
VKLRWAEPLAAAVGTSLVRGLAATWRFRERGREHLDRVRATGRPFIFVLWHSRILPLLARHRDEGIVLLVSRHRDGGYLVDLGARWGYRSVRGSTQRGGEVGLRGVVRALQAGAVVAITPDGPRGPAEQVQPGAIAAAQLAGVALLPIGARAARAWHLNSWDRLCIPKPFATVDVVYGPALVVGAGKEGLRAGISALARALTEVTHG